MIARFIVVFKLYIVSHIEPYMQSGLLAGQTPIAKEPEIPVEQCVKVDMKSSLAIVVNC